jgi:hypothetical protein
MVPSPRIALASALLAAASGCASVQDGLPSRLSITWHEVPLSELQRICNDSTDTLRGCYRTGLTGRECQIYTLPLWTFQQTDRERLFEQTAGHELRHCRDGHFHGAWLCTQSGCQTTANR